MTAPVGAGICLDELVVTLDIYDRDPGLLKLAEAEACEQRYFTDLFRSCCPVTGQPDWASVYIHSCGPPLDSAALLSYLVSYRRHSGFHEQCVEQIFLDIQELQQPVKLTVYARFLRRGGLDINPVRSTEDEPELIARLVRQ